MLYKEAWEWWDRAKARLADTVDTWKGYLKDTVDPESWKALGEQLIGNNESRISWDQTYTPGSNPMQEQRQLWKMEERTGFTPELRADADNLDVRAVADSDFYSHSPGFWYGVSSPVVDTTYGPVIDAARRAPGELKSRDIADYYGGEGYANFRDRLYAATNGYEAFKNPNWLPFVSPLRFSDFQVTDDPRSVDPFARKRTPCCAAMRHLCFYRAGRVRHMLLFCRAVYVFTIVLMRLCGTNRII